MHRIVADLVSIGFYFEAEEVLAEKWIQDVETKWEPPEGFFTQKPSEIMKGLKKYSKDYNQALHRLLFYMNRAGSKRFPKSKKDKWVSMLQKEFGVEGSFNCPEGTQWCPIQRKCVKPAKRNRKPEPGMGRGRNRRKF